MNKTERTIWWIGEHLAYIEDYGNLLNKENFINQIMRIYKKDRNVAETWLRQAKERLNEPRRHYRK